MKENNVMDEEPQLEEMNFKSKFVTLLSEDDIQMKITEGLTAVMSDLEDFIQRGSGWALVQILHLEVNLNKYEPLRGSSYIPLPDTIKAKQACINPQNSDNKCFENCVRIFFLHNKHKDDVSNRIKAVMNNESLSAMQKVNEQNRIRVAHHSRLMRMTNRDAQAIDTEFNLKYVDREDDAPMEIRKIKQFEALNPEVSCNVFGVSENGKKIVGPLALTKKKQNNHINLLFINNNETGHFIWIKDLARLVNSQLNVRGHQNLICDSCLSIFHSRETLVKHLNGSCLKVASQFPKTHVEFVSHNKKIENPFVFYADIETQLKPIDTCDGKPENSCKFLLSLLIMVQGRNF